MFGDLLLESFMQTSTISVEYSLSLRKCNLIEWGWTKI